VSSQCLKRAVREFFKEHKLIDPANLGERTKRLAEEVSKRLMAKGRPSEEASRAAKAAVSAFLPKSEDKDEHKTPYLLFLGETEIERFAAEVEKHWDAFSAKVEVVAADTTAAPTTARRGRGRAAAQAEGSAVPDGFKKAVEKLLDGGKAADLALFGRMLADLPENNVNAACQVAHALSTNKIHAMEMDYFTAVDDLKPGDTAGADMIGTVGFNSACFYRYANLDVGQLTKNLQGDAELTKKAAEAFLTADAVLPLFDHHDAWADATNATTARRIGSGNVGHAMRIASKSGSTVVSCAGFCAAQSERCGNLRERAGGIESHSLRLEPRQRAFERGPSSL